MSHAMLIQQTFSTAIQYHRGGRLSEAESLYRQILQADSNHADALHMLGVLAHQTGRQQLAMDMMSLAIAQNGQVPAFHNNLGNAYAAAGRWQDAETSYRRALDRKRDYAEAHYNLGGALRARGRLDEAVTSYNQALALRPNHAETYLNLSTTLQAQGKLEDAAEACRRAISSKPDLAAAHNNLGNILAAQNRFEAAVTAYSHALALKPDLAQAHRNRGLALLNSGRVDEAVVSFRQAVSHEPDYVAAYVTLGHALTQSGEAEEAVRSYQRAIALDANCGEALLGCAIAPIPIVCGSVAESGVATERFGDHLGTLDPWTCANPGKLGEAIGRVQPFYLAYRPADVTAALCCYGDLASAAATAYWRPAGKSRSQSSPVSGSYPHSRGKWTGQATTSCLGNHTARLDCAPGYTAIRDISLSHGCGRR